MFSHTRVASVLSPLLVALVLLGGCSGAPPPKTTRLHYLIANGEVDGKDTYSSVVQVIIPDRGACSGILAGPNLVLTAAHCFCFPELGTLSANTTYSVSRSNRQNEVSLQCSQTVEIAAMVHAPVDATPRRLSSRRRSRPGDARILPFKGPVRVQIHEGYQFRTDGDADVVASEMDLAAVYLGGALEGAHVDGSIFDREVKANEMVVAVGYGPTGTEPAGGRYFGTAKVLDLEFASASDKVLAFGRAGASFQYAYALKGDSGGPCFREDMDGRRWLVGIMSHGVIQGSDPITFFTSVFHHREWIKRQRLLSEQFAKSL